MLLKIMAFSSDSAEVWDTSRYSARSAHCLANVLNCGIRINYQYHCPR